MKNKGFTLVELLAVIAVLMLLVAVIAPKVMEQLNTSKTITQQEQINTLINITKIYTNEHTDRLPNENQTSIITIDELMQSGMISKKQIIDPKTKEEMIGCIKITNENNKFKYEYSKNRCDEVVIVTLDAQGGKLEKTTKNVIIGQKYGELPTPTKDGYTFMGWNGNNLASMINSNNYTITHHRDRTTSEFKTENNMNYIRVYGNSSASSIDTSWNIIDNNELNLTAGSVYNLSFDVRSKNALAIQLIKQTGSNAGNTAIYKENNNSRDNVIGNIDNNVNFDNDGEWHHFSSQIEIQQTTSHAILVIGNDAPNLYGENSYIDIANIQLEKGNIETEYEPYYITENVIVTQGQNHTLKAIWKANS